MEMKLEFEVQIDVQTTANHKNSSRQTVSVGRKVVQ